MIVQVYAATSIVDALIMVSLGVDHVGFAVSEHADRAAVLSIEQACAIADALRHKAASSALTFAAALDEIVHIAKRINPDILHIVSEPSKITPEDMVVLHSRVPESVLLMRAIPVENLSSIGLARAFAPVSDIILLDTKLRESSEIGATGLTHDWSISQRIVEQLNIPVILAGGLTPENVAQAIRIVRPWGVDSMTGTNAAHSAVDKDWLQVRRFVQAAKTASEMMDNSVNVSEAPSV